MRFQLLLQTAVLSLGLAIATPSLAGTLAPVAADEINHLLTHLQSSGCQFIRNGDWHDATEATEHLQKKLNYAVDKGVITSAEEFIDQVASQSSLSGKHYLVRCNQTAPQPSGQWLHAELGRYRARNQ